MKTIALIPLESQAPAFASFNPEPDPAALEAAAERLELIRAELDTQARKHWQHGEDTDGMADWLKAAALKLAIRTLQTRRDGACVALFRPVSFDYARRVLWDVANEWTEIAGLSLAVPDMETNGSALTNAAALRYAAQLLAGESPATEIQLAA